MSMPRLFRALTHRNFRLFFLGQGISLIGTWMQQVALAWLVFELTGSPFWLGLVGFAGQLPTFFLAPVAGVLIDRTERHRLLLFTQTLAMSQALVVAVLALSGAITVWEILPLSMFLGLVNAFDMPGRQAFLTDLVGRGGDLGNAIALNSSLVNGARLVGPALAALLLARAGPAACFVVNAASYVAVLAALLAMRDVPRRSGRPAAPLAQGLGEGFRYAFGFPPIRALLLLLALISLAGMPFTVLLPVFATRVLHGGAETLGLLSAASGAGALCAALMLASRRSVLGLGRWIAIAPAISGLGLIGFGFSTSLWLSMLLLAIVGFAMMAHMAASNTILQTIVEEDKRGRVMSLYTMAFFGTMPLGSLLAGTLADHLGAPMTVLVCGCVCMAGSVFFSLQLPALRQSVRPIYARMGILPPMVSGLQTASELTVPPEKQ
jgi:MFS family permease